LLLDGKRVLSCLTLAAQYQLAKLITSPPDEQLALISGD
jgi:aerobic-type carbon monoxide dehydrogenase small subunit (CoxS/CutS family)